jgi:hypothetical protein
MVYGFVGLGSGVAQADAVTMVLANNEIEVPSNSGQFRALLEGYYVLLVATRCPGRVATLKFWSATRTTSTISLTPFNTA